MPVNLLITFIVTTLIGQAIVVGIGALVDYYYPTAISLLIFFPLFFLTFWVTWRLSIKLTEPKTSIDNSAAT
jgi:hypothetical protein